MKKFVLLLTLIVNPILAQAETTYTYTCAGYTDESLTFVFDGTSQGKLKYYGMDIDVAYNTSQTDAGQMIYLTLNPKVSRNPMGELHSALTVKDLNGSNPVSEGLYHLKGDIQGNPVNCYLQFKPTPPTRCPRCK